MDIAWTSVKMPNGTHTCFFINVIYHVDKINKFDSRKDITVEVKQEVYVKKCKEKNLHETRSKNQLMFE